MREWIDVEEEMPPKETDVLVCGIRHGGIAYDVAGYFYGDWLSQNTERQCLFDVTHWMDLPEHPSSAG